MDVQSLGWNRPLPSRYLCCLVAVSNFHAHNVLCDSHSPQKTAALTARAEADARHAAVFEDKAAAALAEHHAFKAAAAHHRRRVRHYHNMVRTD